MPRQKHVTIDLTPPADQPGRRGLLARRRDAKRDQDQRTDYALALAVAQARLAEQERRRNANGTSDLAVRLRGEHLKPTDPEITATTWRNRRLIWPHVAAWLVYATGAAAYGIAVLSDRTTNGAANGASAGTGHGWARSSWFLGALAVAALVTVLTGLLASKTGRWRARIAASGLAGAGWLAWTVNTGLSWVTTSALLVAYYLLAARWWQETRHGYPDGPPRPKPVEKPAEPTRPDRGDIVGNWDWSIGCQNGPLAGTYLHSPEHTEHAESYTVALVPGKHSLSKTLGQLDVIATGLRRPAEEIILEPHPSRDSSLLRLTVVTASPIRTTVPFTGPRFTWDGAEGTDLWLEIGTYADGAGRVRIQMLAKNSARHLVLFGGQGSGKSGLLNLLALQLMATGCVDVVYLDGQDGASSPQLLQYADWPLTGTDGSKTLRTALRRIFEKRAKILRAKRWAGWQTSPEYPALAVFVDECHLVLDKTDPAAIAEWEDLSSIARKVGVSFIFATQHPGLGSLGNSDKLRSLLQQYTMIVLRTASKVAGGILRLAVDPADLPDLPGYGYVIAGNKEAVRSAPFRADFLDDAGGNADRWFEQYPPVGFDRATAAAAGVPYLQRREIAQQAQADIEAEIAALEAGLDIDRPETAAMDPGVETAAARSAVGSLLAAAPAFPSAIPAPRPVGHTAEDNPTTTVLSNRAATRQIGEPGAAQGTEPDIGREARTGYSNSLVAVYAALASGASRPTEIATLAGLSLSRTYDLLDELVNARAAIKPGRGRYALTGVPTPSGASGPAVDMPGQQGDQ